MTAPLSPLSSILTARPVEGVPGRVLLGHAMDNVIVTELTDLGFGPFFEQQWETLDATGLVPARIATEHRGALEVWSTAGPWLARLTGRLRRQVEEDDALPGVGDWVAVKPPAGPGSTATVEHVLARRTVFTRGAAGPVARAQVVAANVDVVLVVCGLDGDFNLHRLDRYLARVFASGAQPAVVLNKVDMCAEHAERAASVRARYPDVPVHVTNATSGEGLPPIRAGISAGLTVALVGSSGAGKSTLANALLGEELMATAAVRSHDDQGCHTTTRRQLLLLPGHGLLLDTPGMRELQLLDGAGLDAVFQDVHEVARHCRFTDCRHESEPGCAVRAAVEAGELDPDRLEHARNLEREAEAYARRHDARLRKQTGRLWGQMHAEANQLRRLKRGE